MYKKAIMYTVTCHYRWQRYKKLVFSVKAVFVLCVHMSTWLTISFQSLMRVSVRPLLSVYSVKLKVAAAPHKSSSLSASLIDTSAWARLFRSYTQTHTHTHIVICAHSTLNIHFYITSMLPYEMITSKRNHLCQSSEVDNIITNCKDGDVLCGLPEM